MWIVNQNVTHAKGSDRGQTERDPPTAREHLASRPPWPDLNPRVDAPLVDFRNISAPEQRPSRRVVDQASESIGSCANLSRSRALGTLAAVPIIVEAIGDDQRSNSSRRIASVPTHPSASIAGRTMQESVYKRRIEPRRLPEDAPNILIVLIDDAGPGLPTTFGGEVTPRDGPCCP